MKDYKALQEKLVKLEPQAIHIEFDEETHTYIFNGNILKSVTQLLAEKGISPSYDHVDEEIVKKAAEKGTAIHKLIENWIKSGAGEENPYLDNFIDYLDKNNLIVVGSEVKVANDKLGGTIDLILYNTKTGEYYIVDIKTTSVIHTYSVSWQLSLYDLLETQRKYAKALVFHFAKNDSEFAKEGDLTVKEIDFQDKELVKTFAETEKLPTLTIDSDELVKVEEAVALIESYKAKIKEHEAFVNSFQESLISAMEENNVKSYENDRLKITYVAPVKRETLDSKKLKADLPDVASKYTKVTTTKASVRITLKGNGDEKE